MNNAVVSVDAARENFLWYSYFGITRNDAYKDIDKALKKVIWRAYRDFNRTLQFAFTGSGKTIDMSDEEFTRLIGIIIGEDPESIRLTNRLKASFEKAKGFWKTGADGEGGIQAYIADCIIGLIRGFHDEGDQNDLLHQYDSWHKCLCEKITEWPNKVYGDNVEVIFKEGITGGQAQKWVNMIMKYLYLMNLDCEDLNVSRLSPYIHVPIDDTVVKQAKEHFGIQPSINFGSAISWSKWDYDQYFDFQKKLRASIRDSNSSESPIEWESKVWIDTSI